MEKVFDAVGFVVPGLNLYAYQSAAYSQVFEMVQSGAVINITGWKIRHRVWDSEGTILLEHEETIAVGTSGLFTIDYSDTLMAAAAEGEHTCDFSYELAGVRYPLWQCGFVIQAST